MLGLLLPLLAGAGPTASASGVGVGVGVGVPAAHADPLPSPEAGIPVPVDPLTVKITRVDPPAGSFGAPVPVHVSGTVANTSTAVVTDLRIRLRWRTERLANRNRLAAAAAVPPRPPGTLVVPGTETVLTGSLAPGRSHGFSLTLPASLAGTADTGVHIVVVQVVAPDGSQLGLGRSFFSTATPDVAPTRTVWLWPLVDAPHRASGDVFLDDTLATSLTGNGRLARLLAAADRPDPPTLAIDPMLLEDVSLMTARDGYLVDAGGAGARPVPGTGGAAATAWLARLRALAARSQVLALPYGDPDAVALQRLGLGGQLAVAARRGRELWAKLMPGVPTLADVAWPAHEALDAATAGTYAADGAKAVVLRTSSLSAGSTPTTPTARSVLPQATTRSIPLDVLLVDDVVSTSIGQRGADEWAATTSIQRTLAELTQITAEAPHDARTVLITPPRIWDPTATYLARLLAALDATPWLARTTLPALRAERPASGAPGVPLLYGDPAGHQEISPDQLRKAAAWSATTARFAGALTAPDAVLKPAADTRLRLQSQSLGRLRKTGTTLLTAARHETDLLEGKVHVLPSHWSLSASQDVSVSVVNELDQAVRVRVGFAPDSPAMTMRGGGVQTVPAHKTATFTARARVYVNARVTVQASLLSPANETISPVTVPLVVTIRRVGAATTIVIVGAALVLFAAAGVRTTRRLRGKARVSV